MSRFIKTTNGYLNQDHILLIRFGTAKTAEEGFDLIQMSDGRNVQTQIMDFDWLQPEYADDARDRSMALDETPAAEPKYGVGAAAAAGDEQQEMGKEERDGQP